MTTRRIDQKTGAAAPQAPSDLIDFFLRWREFRDVAAALETKRGLSAQERQVTRWLVAVMDRISVRDLQ